MIKVVVNGSKGRMGQELVKAVESNKELKLVGQADLGDNLPGIIRDSKADVVVDFTNPAVRMVNFQAIINNGARAVIGTTGYTEKEIKELADLCKAKKLGAIIAPNFTIGAILMMRFAAEAAKYLNNAEIIELHHEKKEDYPSGTAVKTAQMMLANRPRFNEDIKDKVATVEGARGGDMGGIKLHSVRMPGFMAHQEVIFGAAGQYLTIRHDSVSRECYMPGVMMAIKKVMELNELVYGLEKIM